MTDKPHLNCPFCKAGEIVSQEYKGGESYHCPVCMRAVPLFCVALRWYEELTTTRAEVERLKAQLANTKELLRDAREPPVS